MLFGESPVESQLIASNLGRSTDLLHRGNSHKVCTVSGIITLIFCWMLCEKVLGLYRFLPPTEDFPKVHLLVDVFVVERIFAEGLK